ncbi:phosphotransferase family protein [Solihabitans fulvus]|uniref:Phosphotransferase family protein n=1 Tax=Solihabitans fulvus TaxID=1892852 RepID=A0A5B2XC85_9PSEU|nr:phosphotransferase family protein [Solihabitans fulvus]KAA2261197.1 phosphotransferase family protein [Solihabitans fulvus]
MTATAPDLRQLAERVSNALGGTRIRELGPLAGGASGLTYLAVSADGMRVVVKVAPRGVPPVRNRDVLRQAALLRRLASVPGVAVPAVLFDAPGESLDVPPLFGCEFVAGEALEPIMDPDVVLPPPQRIAARARHAAAMLAALHAAPATVLGDEPAVGLHAEVARWQRVFETASVEHGPLATMVRDALLAGLPAALPATVVHGDFRLGNLLCRGDRVRAVIDWEIWAASDPRVDLLWFLSFTHPDRMPTAVRAAPGMPDAEELLAAYRAAGGGDPCDLTWFDALVRFKHAAVTALLAKHNGRRAVPDRRLARAVETVPGSLRTAIALLD